MVLSWKIKILWVLFALAILVGCRNAPNPRPTPKSTSSPEFPTGVVNLPEGNHLLFYSNRDSVPALYIMRPDGTGVQRLSFSNLIGFQINEIRWVAELNAFVVGLKETMSLQEDLYLIDVQGNIIQRLTEDFSGEGFPEFSPANGQFTFVCVRSDLDICSVASNGSNLINLTLFPSRETNPHWSPSGEQVVFVSNRSAIPGIWMVNKDGTDLRNLSENISFPEDKPSWSPDGSSILFQSQRDGNWEIYINEIISQKTTNLTNNSASDINPIWSPDGKYIAFQSDRGGGYDIYVIKNDGSSITKLTNTPDIKETNYIWSTNSKEIYYVSPTEDQTRDIFSVNLDGTGIINLTNNPADDFDIQWLGQ